MTEARWTKHNFTAIVFDDGSLELQTPGIGTSLSAEPAGELVAFLAEHYGRPSAAKLEGSTGVSGFNPSKDPIGGGKSIPPVSRKRGRADAH